MPIQSNNHYKGGKRNEFLSIHRNPQSSYSIGSFGFTYDWLWIQTATPLSPTRNFYAISSYFTPCCNLYHYGAIIHGDNYRKAVNIDYHIRFFSCHSRDDNSDSRCMDSRRMAPETVNPILCS